MSAKSSAARNRHFLIKFSRKNHRSRKVRLTVSFTVLDGVVEVRRFEEGRPVQPETVYRLSIEQARSYYAQLVANHFKPVKKGSAK